MKRKDSILQTALRMFNQTNTQAVTTNHIAKEMGISPGNLHYHYKSREEIIRILYGQMVDKMTLSLEELPQNIKELNKHQKLLIEVQWEYRFFFREILFLLSRDKELEKQYQEDNLAHRSRIKIVMQHFIANGELEIMYDHTLEYLVDSILISWQFYTSYLQTLGKKVDLQSAQEAVEFTNNCMRPFLTKKAFL